MSEGAKMSKTIILLTALTMLVTVGAPGGSSGQAGIDRQLLNDINAIKAIDNHAHPLKYVANSEKPDDEFDALPLDAIPPFPLPVRLSPTNPEFIRAWHDLYGYSHHDMSEAHLSELMATKQNIVKQKGENTPAWILDQLNIETMFANRVAMGRGLSGPRFRWVSFDDALLFPLSNETAKRANVDYKGFYPAEEKLLKRYMIETALPDRRATAPTSHQRKSSFQSSSFFERNPKRVRESLYARADARQLTLDLIILEPQSADVVQQIINLIIRNSNAEVFRGYVFDLMRLVQDYRRVIRQHRAIRAVAQREVGKEQMMIYDDDVRIDCALPHLRDETRLKVRTLLPQTSVRARIDVPPERQALRQT